MYLGTALASVIGYLFGSISFSIIIVFIKTKNDIRNHGSKNAGATNVSRILGKRWGIFIVFLDAMKVIIAALIAALFNMIPSDLFNKTNFIIPAFAALIGHCYPIYYKFKGGKAVSCFLAIALLTNSMLGLAFLLIFIAILMITRKISPASIITAAFIAGICFVPQIYGIDSFELNGSIAFEEAYDKGFTWLNFINRAHIWEHNISGVTTPQFYDSMLSYQLVVVASAIILIAKHSQNINRLIKGIEPNFFTFNKEEKAAKKAEMKKLREQMMREAEKENKKIEEKSS
jgi:glycerol-3-phosphate acyltransferase PlsY